MKTWSSTQSSVALSSGEAAFNGVVKGAGIGLGYQSLLADLGIVAGLRVWTDSSAAIWICSRQGLGKLRHLDTHTLWVQQAVRSRRVDLRKVAGEQNPADLFTKHSLTRERLQKLTGLFECDFRGGRAESAPEVRITPGIRTTMSEAFTVEQGSYNDDELIMPHSVYNGDELDRGYPPLQVADEVDGPDLQCDDNDALVQHGKVIAQDITQMAAEYGRRVSYRCA